MKSPPGMPHHDEYPLKGLGNTEIVNMKRKRRDPQKLRKLREIVQLVFLLILFLLLFRAISGRVERTGTPLVVFSAVIVLLSTTLGRVWCSWACPVNTILDRVHFHGALSRGGRIPDRWRLLRYLLLGVSVVAGLILVIGVQPTERVTPPGGAPNPMVTVWAAIGLLVIVGLEYFAEHFWCRYLCPLGGALALLARIAPMRRIVRAHCNECAICVDSCPVGVIDHRRGFRSARGECTVCLDCLVVCTSSSTGFSFRGHTADQADNIVRETSLKAVQQ